MGYNKWSNSKSKNGWSFCDQLIYSIVYDFFIPSFCKAADDFNLFVSDGIQTPASAINLVKLVSYCPNAT